MLRDTRKPARYFEEYITYQIGRIEKFEDVLRKLEKEDTAKKMQCHVYLTNFYQDLLLAKYSAGSNVDLLKKDYIKYLSHICPQDSPTYDTALSALSWAVLLDVRNRIILDDIHYPQDGMLDAFYRYLTGTWPLDDSERLPLISPSSKPFVESLMGEISPDGLNHYIENDWYGSNSEAAWYESDKLATDTYCGYWCLAGAAVVKIMQWNPCLFANNVYFPIDLLL